MSEKNGIVFGWKTSMAEYGQEPEGFPDQVIGVFRAFDLDYVEGMGGIDMQIVAAEGLAGLACEDYVMVEGNTSLENLAKVRVALSKLLAHPETLTIEAEGLAGVNVA